MTLAVPQNLGSTADSNSIYEMKKQKKLDLPTASSRSRASLANGGAPLPAPPMLLGGMKLRFRCTANLSRGVQPADAAAAVAAATAARFCGGTIQCRVFT